MVILTKLPPPVVHFDENLFLQTNFIVSIDIFFILWYYNLAKGHAKFF